MIFVMIIATSSAAVVIGLIWSGVRTLRARYAEDEEERLGDAVRGKPLAAPSIGMALAAIQARDPAFALPAFLADATQLFVDLQSTWSMGAFDPVRSRMSDGLLRRFTVQLALDRLHGKRNVTADVRVLEAEVVGVESDGEVDTIHVCFDARLRDCDVSPAISDAQALGCASRAEASTFREYWSFVRRLTATTPSDAAARKRCPSCGAPVPAQATVTCEYCNAVLNSGAYGWVLAEITQEHEFRSEESGSVEGFARLEADDPALNRQVLEDRASLILWKWIEAQATGRIRLFARLCSPGALEEMAKRDGRPSESFGEAAIGAVDLVDVACDEKCDRARFDVRWSTSGAGTGEVLESRLVLARTRGIKTNAATGLGTDRCHRCAAIQTDSEAVDCSYCGALLSQDWVFERLEHSSRAS